MGFWPDVLHNQPLHVPGGRVRQRPLTPRHHSRSQVLRATFGIAATAGI